MFGYKIEIWRYETANYDKAQEHILAMAEKGYELTDISTYWVPLAGYRKTENTRRRKYCVVLVPTDDENFMQLCEDSGWHLLAKTKYGPAVLYSEDMEAKPIFTEEESEAIMAQKVVEDKNENAGCAYVIAVPIMLLATKFTWALLDNNFEGMAIKSILAVSWGILIIEFISIILEERALKEQIRLAREGDVYEKPEWLYKFYSFKIIISLVCLLGLTAFEIWRFVDIGTTFATLFGAALPLVFLTGAFLKVFKHMKWPGQILMMIAVFFMVAGPQLVMDL